MESLVQLNIDLSILIKKFIAHKINYIYFRPCVKIIASFMDTINWNKRA